jgi:hypothetical protein
MNEFEQKRLENIERNKQLLISEFGLKVDKNPRKRNKKIKEISVLRSSKRINKTNLTEQKELNKEPLELINFEDFFSDEIVKKAIKTAGKFKGNLAQQVVDNYNLNSDLGTSKFQTKNIINKTKNMVKCKICRLQVI